MKTILTLLSITTALFIAGCSSEPEVVHVKYPTTYTVQVGNTHAVSDSGPQNTRTETTQRLTVEPGQPIFYKVESGFKVSVTIFEVPTADTRHQIGALEGDNFTAQITPQAAIVEVVFAASEPNTGGSLKFTVSDHPIGD